MAALLVALAVMAVMMSVALPVWRHEAQRQKEDELIWRGQQYVRAIRLFASKNGGILPPSVDSLVSGHFLRKKYKDPITNDEFDYLGAGATTPGLPPGQGQGRAGRAGQPQQSTMSTSAPGQPTSTISTGGTVPGGLSGVRSKSKDESIKVYQGRTHYNEWTFIYMNQNPGINGPGRGQPGAIGPNGQPLGPGRGLGPNGQPLGPGRGLGPNGQPLPFPPFGPSGPGRGGPIGPGGNPTQVPPGFPPNPGRRGGGGL
jgi:type II secretory pathway pseudopilin PulG